MEERENEVYKKKGGREYLPKDVHRGKYLAAAAASFKKLIVVS